METAQKYFEELRNLFDHLPIASILEVVKVLKQARLYGNRVFVMGNGGSAATASHFVCDLSKNTRLAGIPDFRVIGLCDNVPSMLAYANDEGYENVFARQLSSLVQAHDIVIGISASGNSLNVLNAIQVAREAGAVTIGFAGFDGGRLETMVDFCIRVPSQSIEQVEDVHLIIEHLICRELRLQNPEEENHPFFFALSKDVSPIFLKNNQAPNRASVSPPHGL